MKDRFFRVHFVGSNVNNEHDKMDLQVNDQLDFLHIMGIVESSYFNFQGGECSIYKGNDGFIIELECHLLYEYKIVFVELENY